MPFLLNPTRSAATALVLALAALAFTMSACAPMAASIARKPELNLYVTDKRHPSLAGTYLAACVTLASIYNVSPVGNSYTGGLDAASARHLQEVAWETVSQYHKR